jgi:hypothetical protein
MFAFCGFADIPATRGTRTTKSAPALFESLGSDWFLELHPGGRRIDHLTG